VRLLRGRESNALNPSQARLGRRAENEREGAQTMDKCGKRFCKKKVDIGEV